MTSHTLDVFQACTTEKSEIEFIKNGLDMVVKKAADDHAKKLSDVEKRSAQAFDSKCNERSAQAVDSKSNERSAQAVDSKSNERSV